MFAAAARRCGRCGLREPFCPNAIRDEMGLTGSKRLNGARGLVLHRPASLQAPKIQARPKGFYSGPSSGIRNMSRGISRVTAGCSAWKGLVAKGGNVRNAMDYFRSATSVLQRTAC